MQQITSLELQRLLQNPETRPVLLDVREPHEFAYCRIEDSLNIPMNSVPARIGELDPTRKTVVICHHGMRSANVAHTLIRYDFADIINLAGGIDAWAERVEPDMPRY